MTQTKQSTITVTFYFGSGDERLFQLNKKYIVANWQTEADLQKYLDEIATEMNYLSGYGIRSIKVVADELNFIFDYKDKLVPFRETEDTKYTAKYWFDYSLQFLSLQTFRKTIWLEIPYFTFFSQNTPQYKPDDRIFKPKAIATGRRPGKTRRSFRNKYHLVCDHNDPLLSSFVYKIANGILLPNTTIISNIPSKYPDEKSIKSSIAWNQLPKSQTTLYKIRKKRKKEEKEQKRIEAEKKRLEKMGVVYQDKTKKKKSVQVYIIEMADENLKYPLYKIGISNAPGRRLQSLNTASPFELKLIHKFVAEPAEDAEANLHLKYQKYRMKGEWFKLPSDEVIALKKIKRYEGGEFVNH